MTDNNAEVRDSRPISLKYLIGRTPEDLAEKQRDVDGFKKLQDLGAIRGHGVNSKEYEEVLARNHSSRNAENSLLEQVSDKVPKRGLLRRIGQRLFGFPPPRDFP